MPIRRTSHAVYDTQYHLVWEPKYRKWILRGDIRAHVESLFEQIAEDFGFDIEEMEVANDHVHRVFRPVASSRNTRRSSGSCGGGELWEDGYFARTVGDKVTAEIIKRYIRYHRQEKMSPQQLDLFDG